MVPKKIQNDYNWQATFKLFIIIIHHHYLTFAIIFQLTTKTKKLIKKKQRLQIYTIGTGSQA